MASCKALVSSTINSVPWRKFDQPPCLVVLHVGVQACVDNERKILRALLFFFRLVRIFLVFTSTVTSDEGNSNEHCSRQEEDAQLFSMFCCRLPDS